jgi:hypothetical protein
MADDLFGWPGDGLHWAWQRCGRYEYRKVLMHSNPDHLVPSAPSPTNVPPCRSPTGGEEAAWFEHDRSHLS